MAGSVLPQTNDPMPNINKNIEGWGTDAAGTDLTVGDKYADLINVKGAKFLDLYNSSSVKIDDADDLKDALKEYDVQMSIAFNDNPDNDEFRKAYIVVITGLSKKDTTVTPTTGDVKFASGLTGVGTLSNTSVETLGSGSTTVSFTLTKPEWAAPAAATPAASSVSFTYDVYVDGVKWSVGGAMSAGDFKVNSDNTAWTIKDEVITGTDLTTSEAKGHKVEIVITSVDWKYAVVEYQLNDKVVEVDKTNTTMIMPTSGATGAQIKFAVKGVAAAAGTYTVSGIQAKDKSGADLAVADYSNLTVGDITNYPAAGKFFLAKGGEKVIVKITATMTTELYDITIGGKAITAATCTNIRIQDNNLLNTSDRPLDYATQNLGSIAVMKRDDGIPGATSVAKGTPVTFVIGATATDAGCTVAGLKGFKVYATLTNGTTKKEVVVDATNLTFGGTENGNEGIVKVTAEGPVDLTIDRVEMLGAVAKAANAAEQTLDITFNKAIKLDDASKVTVTTAGSATKLSVAAEGNILKISASNVTEWATDETIQVAAAAVSTEDCANGQITFKIVKAADGTYSAQLQ